MKRLAATLMLIAFGMFALPAQAQTQQASNLHYVAGVFYAPNYASYKATVVSGNSATGSGQTIVVTAAGPLADGTTLPAATMFNTSTPILVNDNNAETVTPSAVSTGACPAGNAGIGSSVQCATITGTFNNLHGPGAVVQSGDNGIEEAITDAANNGGGLVYFQADCGIVPLSTSATTTTTTTCSVPLRFLTAGASVKVTTAVTTSASYSIGTTTSTTAWMTSCTALTLGANCLAFTTAPTEVAGATYALTPVLITTNATAGAGALHVKVYGYSQVQSAQ